MLRVTRLTDYAIVVASALARDPSAAHRAAEVARVAAVPEPTVRKVLRLLLRGGIVTSTRGAKGGYRLARPPREIDVAQIVTAVEGPIAMTECLSEETACEQEVACVLRPNWQIINDAVHAALSSVTLEAMAAPRPEGLIPLRRPRRAGAC